MSITVRQGSLEEVVAVVATINEFVRKETVHTLNERLQGKKSLVLVALQDEQLLGFKIGYQLSSDEFYSWFGGVSPQARGYGVAQRLLEEQEAWALEQGYQRLRVKSRNQFPSMLRLLLRNNYLIDNYEKMEDISESRIHFVKQLSK